METFHISEKTRHEFIDQSNVMHFEELGIVQCGVATCIEKFLVHRKNQQKHMLLYSVSGLGWIKTGNGRVQLEPGSMVTVPAGIENTIGMGLDGEGDEEWRIAWVFLDPKLDWQRLVSDKMEYQLTSICEVMFTCIQTLLRSIILPIDYGYAIADLSVKQIKYMLDIPKVQQQSKHSVRLNRVFDQVQRQLHSNWDVSKLASLYPCSEAHFHRLCQKQFGHSPIAHLTRMRMEYAARLLRSTEWPIQHIGETVGYAVPANFSARFKAWCGLSPREFRQSKTVIAPL